MRVYEHDVQGTDRSLKHVAGVTMPRFRVIFTDDCHCTSPPGPSSSDISTAGRGLCLEGAWVAQNQG